MALKVTAHWIEHSSKLAYTPVAWCHLNPCHIFGHYIPHWFRLRLTVLWLLDQYLIKDANTIQMQHISPPLFPCILRRGYKRRNGMFFQGRRVKMSYTLLKDSSKRDGKWNDNKTLSFSTPNTQLPTEPFTHHHTGSLVLTDSLFSSNQAAVPAAEPERTLGNQAFRGLFPLRCCITLCHTQLILTFHPKTKLSRSSLPFITVYTRTDTDVNDFKYCR